MFKDKELMKELLRKKGLAMKNSDTYSQGNAVTSPSDEEDVRDEKAKLDTKKSDLAPDTEQIDSVEKGLLGDMNDEAELEDNPEEEAMDEEADAALSEEEILKKLFDESSLGKPGIAGKVAALMKSKMKGKA